MKTEEEIKAEIQRHLDHRDSVQYEVGSGIVVAMDNCMASSLNWVLTGEFKIL